MYQWLASQCVYCNSNYATFYVRFIGSNVYRGSLYDSYGYLGGDALHVRPVVTLSSNIQLSGNSETGWTIN